MCSPKNTTSSVATAARADAGIVPMVSKKKMTISWSGGKDSAFALYSLLKAGESEVVSLHTVFDKNTHRVGMHGVREDLIERQAASLGLPLVKLYLEPTQDHSEYKKLMQAFYKRCAAEKIDAVAFGDIFLEDLKAYRETLLLPSGLKSIYPLWQKDTKTLLEHFISAGFRTLICAADTRYFSPEQVGKTIDTMFVETLPTEVDPCGENGEFHTFVFDGPVFDKTIEFKTGTVVQKKYDYEIKDSEGNLQRLERAFWFQDLFA